MRLTKMSFMNCDNTNHSITHIHKQDQITSLRKRLRYSEMYKNNCENQDKGENYLLDQQRNNKKVVKT